MSMTVNSGVCAGAPVALGHVDEHVPREQAVPGLLGDDADRQPVARVGAGVAVLHEELAALDVVEQPLVQRVEVPRLDRPVDLAPPDACPRSTARWTMNLSFGERPVCCPVRQTSGPSTEMQRLRGACTASS